MLSNDKKNIVLKALKNLSDEQDEKIIWDKALDILEVLIELSPTKLDNFIVLPIIKILRKRLDIPDND